MDKTNITNRAAIPIAAAVLIAASGVLHAVQTGAWGREQLLAASASRVEKLPLEIDGWKGKELEFDARQLKVAQASGAISRTYTKAENGAVLNVMMLCGPSGPIAVHPPTICFTAAGYVQVTKQRRVEVSSPDGRKFGSFWVADFEWRQDGGIPDRIRTYWGWSSDGQWRSPDYPRYEFAGSQVLHKLYVTRQVDSEQTEPKVIEGFLQDFLPTVNSHLFSA
ncbi:MAG: exosortase-associated EpsI family protein [Planctomycetaceae bacterium]|nr:exosortase-associated EpsI family protein [Planctomycetaceae bacterium]